MIQPLLEFHNVDLTSILNKTSSG